MRKIIIIHDTGNPDAETLAREIVANGIPADADPVYRNRRNRIYKIDFKNRSYNIKAFKIPGLINSIVYTTFRRSKARRSYENARRLSELGLDTPKPYAYIEVRNGLRLHESYYICEHIIADDMREWEHKPDSGHLVMALAKEMARLHKAGVLHKDFSPGNILYTGNSEKGYRFYYVDLNRMRFGVKSKKAFMGNFRSINLDEKETARLGRHYGEASGLDPEKTAGEAVRQLRRYLCRKKLHRTIKQSFKI